MAAALMIAQLAIADAIAASPESRPPSVVVKVEGGGFHWGDAAIGAAAAIATGVLVLGLVLTFRPGRRTP